MMETGDVTALLDVLQSLGNWALFFWLFVKQMDRTQKISDEHKADLRRIAKLTPLGQEETD